MVFVHHLPRRLLLSTGLVFLLLSNLVSVADGRPILVMDHTPRPRLQARAYLVCFRLFTISIVFETHFSHVGNLTGAIFPLFVDGMFIKMGFTWANTLFASLAVALIPVPFVSDLETLQWFETFFTLQSTL